MKRVKTAMKPAALRKLRERAGMTTTDLGARLGVSSRTVDRWEAGITAISRFHLLAINAVLLPGDKPAEDVTTEAARA